MRPAEVVELLPCGQFLVQIHVVRVGQQLEELLLIGPVRSLDRPILPTPDWTLQGTNQIKPGIYTCMAAIPWRLMTSGLPMILDFLCLRTI